MIRKTFRVMLCVLFSITILAGCAKPTEVTTLPPPTDTQVAVKKIQPPPTAIPPIAKTATSTSIPAIEPVSIGTSQPTPLTVEFVGKIAEHDLFTRIG